MTHEERTKYAAEEAKKSAKNIFKEKPENVKKIFENETILGNLENIAMPDNKSE